MSNNNRSDSQNKHLPRLFSSENQDINNLENQKVDNTPNPVNHLLQENQEASKKKQPIKADFDHKNSLILHEP